MTNALRLVEPGSGLQPALLDLFEDYRRAGEVEGRVELVRSDLRAYLERLRREALGIDLPPGIVPQSTFWLLGDDQLILGESRLRHYLTPELEQEGGHIGYRIRPSVRRRGYGTQILALTLVRARQLDLERVLLTCDTDNIASARIIEKNGGQLAGHAISQWSGKQISRYWIALV